MNADTYVVRPRDTLTSIAARLLGAPTLWMTLADLNDIRDPRAIRPGQELRLR